MSSTWLDLLRSPPICCGNGFCKHSSNPRSLNASGKRHSCQSLGSELNNILLETQIPTGKLIRMRGLWCGDLCFFLSNTSTWAHFSFSVCLKGKVTTSGGTFRFISYLKFFKIQINIFEDIYEVSSFSPVIALCWHLFSPLPPHLCLIIADEFATLCGSQRPGFVIDIYTGLPVGELRCHCWNFLFLPLCLKTGNTPLFSQFGFFFFFLEGKNSYTMPFSFIETRILSPKQRANTPRSSAWLAATVVAREWGGWKPFHKSTIQLSSTNPRHQQRERFWE